MSGKTSYQRAVRVREQPRISAPKLGDYMVLASASGRRRLLRDQKIAPDVQTARYRKAVTGIRSSLADAADAGVYLAQASANLRSTTSRSPWHTSDNATSAEALDRFAAFLATFDRTDLKFSETRTKGYKIPVAGVEVSVFPLLRVVRQQKDGIETTGALLAVIRKADKLTDRAGAVTAELIRMALERAGESTVDASLCMVLDVFRGKMFSASKRNKRMRAEIADACQEVATIWPTIRQMSDEGVVLVVRDLPLRSGEIARLPRNVG